MKLAFDQHVPAGVARAFMSLAQETHLRYEMGGFDIRFARDYAPAPTDKDYRKGSDAPWVQRFASDGGEAIISGDTKMRKRPIELLALQETELIVIFFGPTWNKWNFFRKSGLILAHWKVIARTLKKSKKGQFWVVPATWNEDVRLENVTPKRQQISKTSSRQPDRKIQEDGKGIGLRGRPENVRTKTGKGRAAKAGAQKRQSELDFILPDPAKRWDEP